MMAKIILDEHSEAKVSLYYKYLSIYLNVLARSPIQKIYLVDFFCGEGLYENEGKGSPIVALECIRNHYESNNKTCPDIKIIFNDSGYSEIESGVLKIDRVKKIAKGIFSPPNVEIAYSKTDYQQLVKQVITRANQLLPSERALFFIDPWGYKEIKPDEIKSLLDLNYIRKKL